MLTKILIPSDGSVLGNLAALEGIKMAAKLGAEAFGIYVAREYQSPGFSAKTNPTPAEFEAAAKETGAKVLQPLKEAAAQAGAKFTSVLRTNNHTALAIVRAAEEYACDLIFIGSHGCAGWDHILLGSVSNKVLATAQIPVLIYRLKEGEVPDDTPRYYETVFPPA